MENKIAKNEKMLRYYISNSYKPVERQYQEKSMRKYLHPEFADIGINIGIADVLSYIESKDRSYKVYGPAIEFFGRGFEFTREYRGRENKELIEKAAHRLSNGYHLAWHRRFARSIENVLNPRIYHNRFERYKEGITYESRVKFGKLLE